MMQRLLIPIGAGLVSAITYVSVALGHPGLGILLSLVIPLPVLLAGLALGWQAALVAALTSTAFILLAGSPFAAGAFAVSQAAPAVVLSYLALLSRPAVPPEATEWYPAGRLVIACALVGATFSFALMVALGGTHAALKDKIAPVIEAVIKAQPGEAAGPLPIAAEDIPKITEFAVTLLPAMVAVSSMLVLLFNLWLAGRVTLASGHLARPWPDLSWLSYPRGTPLALAAASAAGLLEGFPGMAGTAISGALFFAYVLLGLAIAHHTTRGASWRPFALWALYLALLLVNPMVLLVAMAGLLDTVWPLRNRRDEGLGNRD